ncbi:MAG: helix-turn-helix transcriptional regulator [Psychrobacillus psychrodurans]
MDRRTEILEQLISETQKSKKAFAESIGIPPTTLRSMLDRGIGNASIDNVIKVCKGLGITTDELERMANGEEIEKVNNVVELTPKDKRNIQKQLQKMIEGLDSKNSFAAFGGETMDDLNQEDRELLIASLEKSLEVAKKIAKQKFTPKKYRK